MTMGGRAGCAIRFGLLRSLSDGGYGENARFSTWDIAPLSIRLSPNYRVSPQGFTPSGVHSVSCPNVCFDPEGYAVCQAFGRYFCIVCAHVFDSPMIYVKPRTGPAGESVTRGSAAEGRRTIVLSHPSRKKARLGWGTIH